MVDVYLGYDGENWIAYEGENENAIPEPDKDIEILLKEKPILLYYYDPINFYEYTYIIYSS